MTWQELYDFLTQNFDAKWFQDSVTVYDKSEGEFYPSDVIEFQDGDDVIDSGSVFISIK